MPSTLAENDWIIFATKLQLMWEARRKATWAVLRLRKSNLVTPQAAIAIMAEHMDMERERIANTDVQLPEP